MTRLEISCTTPFATPGWPTVETAPPTTEEDAAEEEEGPGSKGEPEGVTNCGVATSAVDPGFCQEEKGKVEDKGDHRHSCGEAGYAGAATCHGDFTDMCEEAEHSRSGGQDKRDDVEDEAVC